MTLSAFRADAIPFIYATTFFAWGACTGSLLNVVIGRLPRGGSLIEPPSHCPHCGARVRLIDLIPILNWFWLRGRCRDCRGRISPRYPFVEALTASLCGATGYSHAANDFGHYANIAMLMAHLIFICLLIAFAFIRIDRFPIPRALTVGGTVSGIGVSLLVPELHRHAPPFLHAFSIRQQSLLDAVMGAATCAILLAMVKFVSMPQTGSQKPRLIHGDEIWAGSLVGAMTGIIPGLAAILIAFMLAAPSAVAARFLSGEWPPPGQGEDDRLPSLLYRWRTGRETVAFAPFLTMASVVMLLAPDAILIYLE